MVYLAIYKCGLEFESTYLCRSLMMGLSSLMAIFGSFCLLDLIGSSKDLRRMPFSGLNFCGEFRFWVKFGILIGF